MLNVCDLLRCIETDDRPPQIEDCIAVPFYIDAGKRYELYQYELRVEEVNGDTFEEYLLRATGKKSQVYLLNWTRRNYLFPYFDVSQYPALDGKEAVE